MHAIDLQHTQRDSSGRHTTVAGVLFSFAVVVAVVTMMVLNALSHVAQKSNVLDDERSRETISGALHNFVSQLGATLNDYAAWDDAATNVHATDGMDWTVSNYGETSVNSAVRYGCRHRRGQDADHGLPRRQADGRRVGGVFLAGSVGAVRIQEGRRPQDVPEASGFIRTQSGIAVGGVALVRQKSGRAPAAGAGKKRYLIFIRHLDAAKIGEIGKTYVIGGLQLVAADRDAAYSVPIEDTRSACRSASRSGPRGALGDVGYADVRRQVVQALCLVGLFFVVLLIIGWSAGGGRRARRSSPARKRFATG